MYEFRKPSSLALTSKRTGYVKKHNFPFDTIPLGLSFPVGKHETANLQALRSMACREGTRLGRCFRVIVHENEFEVFYFANRDKKVAPNE